LQRNKLIIAPFGAYDFIKMEDTLLEEIAELKKKIIVLEWDTEKRQINAGKTKQLMEFKKKLEVLQAGKIQQETITNN